MNWTVIIGISVAAIVILIPAFMFPFNDDPDKRILKEDREKFNNLKNTHNENSNF